jgi:hypothetical protein
MAILGPVWLLLRGLAVLQNRLGSDIGTCLGSPLMMQWTAPVVGIAKSETAGYDEKLRESAVGYKQLFQPRLPHGEFTPDTRHQSANVGNRSAGFRVALRSRRER